MRLIDADDVIFELNRMLNIVDERNARPNQEEEFKTIRTYVEWTKEVIHDTPTIDAVEVVRCENCKWCYDGYCSKFDDLIPFGHESYEWRTYFCSNGEKEE